MMPKKNIHPEYNQVTVTCSCGETFVTGSTIKKDKMTLEVCSKCHPFYTGKSRVMDQAGRVEKFKNKYKQFTRK